MPPPGGLLPPGGQADCTSLREQLLTLQAQLKEDIAQLNQLLSSPPSLGVTQTQDQIQQWQQTVALKNDEVQYVRGQMEAAGCFETPPRPPPPVVFTEMGPSSIVDGDGKVVGTGAVVDVAVQPGSSDVIFAATAGGGVWQTTNGSSAAPVWATTTDALPSTAMGAVAFAPADASGQTVYAGTGTFSSWPSTGPAVGIYKSTDGGDSWTVTGTGLQGQRVRDIVALAAPNDQVVLATTRLAADSWGIFRSNDGGGTFAPPRAPSPLRGRLPAGDQLPVGEGYALIEDPSAPGRVYCAIGGPQAGIFRSDDAGQGWWRVTTGISGSDLTAPSWIRLAAGQAAPTAGVSALYAGIVGTGGQLTGLYTAVSRPAELGPWAPIPLPPGGGGALNPGSMGASKFAIAAHPDQPLLFVGGEVWGVWRADISDPANPAWTFLSAAAASPDSNVPTGGPHADCQSLVFDAAGNLIVANDGGVYRAAGPGGDQPAWQHIGVGMRITEPLGGSYDTLSAVAVIGSADNGVEYQTAPGSFTWRQLVGGDGGDVDVDNTSDDYSWRYFMSFPGGTVATSFTVYRARFDAVGNVLDPGAKLMLADPGTPNLPLSGIGIADQTTNAIFVTNAVAADRLLLASANVYETFDGGQTAITVIARPVGLGGPARMAYGGRQNGADAPDVAYCAIGNQVWRRQPGEAALTPLASPLEGEAIDISVDPYDWSRVVIIENSRVWRSDQAGDTWAECTGNLPGLAADILGDLNFHNVVIVRAAATSAREVVLVGAYTGLYRTVTAADGASALWEKIGNLPDAVVQSMQYRPLRTGQPGSDVLAVGLQGRGTWVLTEASLYL